MLKKFVFRLFSYIRIVKNNFRAIRFPYKKRMNGRIYVMGNGPSLNASIDFLLSKNNKSTFIAVNDFAVSDIYNMVKPRYYIMVDNAYWDDACNSNPRDIALRETVFSNLVKKTDWELSVFIPDYAYKSGCFKQLINNCKIDIIPFNRFEIKAEKTDFYFNNLLKNNTGYFNNVLANAIYCSINLGFDELCILGAEHSWTEDIRVNDKNQVCTIKKHFFENDSDLIPWQKSDGGIFSMAEILNALTHHFQAYELLAEYAERNHVKVYNMTRGSFIDAFERRNLD